MSGTVNISRDIWRDTAFKDQPFTEREAFIWLVMEASYKGREKRIGNAIVSLERGQLAASVRFMCEAWSWTKSTVDRFLKRLENRDMIGTDSGTGINVITIRKYNEYQNVPNGTGTGRIENRDSSGTAAGQQRDKPNKGLIQDAMQDAKEKGTAAPSCAAAQKPARFDEFWDAFPHRNGVKKGKFDSRKKYATAVRSGISEDKLISAAQAYQADADVQRGYGKGPVPWLNQKCWDDEIANPKLKAINGGHNEQPTNKSKVRMDAFIRGAGSA